MDNALERLFRQGLEQTRASGKDYVRQTEEAVRLYRATRDRIHQKLGDQAPEAVGLRTRRVERTYDPKADGVQPEGARPGSVPPEGAPTEGAPTEGAPTEGAVEETAGMAERTAEEYGESDGESDHPEAVAAERPQNLQEDDEPVDGDRAEDERSESERSAAGRPDDGGATKDLLNIPDFLRRV